MPLASRTWATNSPASMLSLKLAEPTVSLPVSAGVAVSRPLDWSHSLATVAGSSLST